ncbi:MAG: protein kinase, partial [Gammaproteobacteria bacterium]|nr:protein kinase [Gammaproteobacteria bacterium]
AQFRHPNVVRVSSFFENNNTGYMVMEYEDGTDLASLIKAGESFDEQRILDLLLPILDGLGQIHERGFIHRDIKPANIFIRSDGSPVLIDFGSARQAIGGQTRTMTSLVTPGFAPFEQYHDAEGKQGPWTDIYSLGATCYAMITGKPPNDALKRGMARLDHSTDAYLQLTDLRAGRYSEHLLQAIDHALEFKQNDRPQTVSEWRPMLLGETAVPQAGIVTQLGSPATVDIDPASDGRTEVVTRPDEQAAATTQVVTRPDDETVVTAPDVVTEPATAPPAAAEPEAAPAAAPSQAPAAKKGKAKPLIIGAALIVAVVVAMALVSKMQQQSRQEAETSAAEAAELEDRQAEQARIEADKEALREQQARIETEKEKLKQEQARIEAEKILQAEKEALRKEQARVEAEKAKLEQARIAAQKKKQEQARVEAEKKRQAELASKQAADEKRKQQLALKQAQDKERQQQLALQQAAETQQQQSAAAVNMAGSYTPDKGFEELVLTQTGNRVKGSIGTDGSTLEGVVNGNRLEFRFNYSRTGYGFKDGSGVLKLSADGKRLTGIRSQGGFPPQSTWNLTRSDGAPRTSAPLEPFADVSGVYRPDNGFEDLKLRQTGNRIKGEIGTNGSTLEGEREGNKIIFIFSYSRTGYGFKNGHGEFTVSADGKRLNGFRSKGGFPPNSSWNLSRSGSD